MRVVKTVLITGGAKRIGKALVETLHRQGMNIVFQYHRSQSQAEEIVTDCNQKRAGSVVSICADLRSFDAHQQIYQVVLDNFGRLDVLINNAAGFFATPFGEATGENWNELMNVNAGTPFFLAQRCHKLLKQHQGCIINITDIYADRPLKNYPIYCASKSALTSLTLSMAQSFAPEIRVNAVAPGAILPAENEGLESMQTVIERTPLQKLGGPQAIVKAVLFLINDASFITGQIIKVDGGRTAVTA